MGLTFMRDTLRGLKNWRRTPGSALLVVLSLGLSGGAFLTMLSLVNALAWRALPVSHPAELVAITAADRREPAWEDVGFPASLFEALDPTRLFQGVAGFTDNEVAAVVKGTGQRIAIESVSGQYFDTLGVRPVIGHLIDAQEVASVASVAAISFRCWQTRFAGAPDVFGQTFRIQGETVTVIGVASPAFGGVSVGGPIDAWVPASLLPRLYHDADGQIFYQGVAGRLRPGVTLEEARRQVEALWPSARRSVAAAAPPLERPYYLLLEPRVRPGARGFSEAWALYGRTLGLLAVLSGITVVLACVNLSGLLLARWSAREQDLAVQAALGASDGRLISQIFSESLALSTIAVLSSVPLALSSAKTVVLLLWDQPDAFPLDLSLDARALGVMVLLAGLVAVGVSLLPASRVWSGKLALVRGTRGVAGRPIARWGRRLAAAQVALSVPLLVAGWLIAANMHRLEGVNTGFRADGVTIVTPSRQVDGPPAGGSVRYLSQLSAALRARPGVTAVAFAARDPVGGFFSDGSRHQVTSADGAHQTRPFLQAVSPGYFDALSVPRLAGRDFAWTDDPGRPAVAIIPAAVATALFPGHDAVGQRVRLGGTRDRDLEVIGVVADANLANPHEPNQEFLYTPLLQQYPDSVDSATPELLVKSPLPPSVVEAEARRVIVSLGTDNILAVRTMPHVLTVELGRERVMRLGAVFFASLTTLLVFVGLLAVLNVTVARRIPEIGLRVALGASTRDIRWMVIQEALRASAAGLAVGVPSAWAAGRVLASALTLIGAHDALAFGVAILLVLAVTVLSVMIPSRRATRVTPVEALGGN